MKCASCGRTMQKNTGFCICCGAKVKEDEVYENSNVIQPLNRDNYNPKTLDNKKAVVIASVAVFSVVALITSLVIGFVLIFHTIESLSDLREYETPTFEKEINIYDVATESQWEFVGIADNPNHVGGEQWDLDIEAVSDYYSTIEFYKNYQVVISGEDYEEAFSNELWYTVYDDNYCDTWLLEDDYGDWGYRFYLGTDGLIYVCYFNVDGDEYPDSSDFFVFRSNGIKPVVDNDMFFPEGLTENIEDVVVDELWVSNDVTIPNKAVVDVADGYPVEYYPEYGQYEYFFKDGELEFNIYKDGKLGYSSKSTYVVDDTGKYLSAFNRIDTIEDNEYEIYSVFFVSDNVLYEVEMIDGHEVSNFVGYEIKPD